MPSFPVYRLALLAWCALGFQFARGMDLVAVVKQVEPGVVRIETDQGTGSGVVVDARGFVLTNFHVIDGAKWVKVMLRSGEVISAEGFLIAEPRYDIALLKTEALAASRVMKLAVELPQIGEKVAAFGNPIGFSFTTSEGIASSIRPGREVREAIGEVLYAKLGYDLDTTWVQTTAPISHGNSGGPLVNMNGDVVGLNTWGHPAGQNLNFAISMVDIQRVMSKSEGANPREFAKLPRVRGTALPPPASAHPSPRDFKVELPTGRVFSLGVFDTSDAQRAAGINNPGMVVIRHPNGSVFAAAGQQGGKLHGITVAQYDNQEPMTHVSYLDGKRHGILKTWSEAGKPVLLAQYTKGKRHGFSCFFDDNSLRLLIEHQNDAIKWVQLMDDLTVLTGFPSREEADKDDSARDLLEKLDKFEATLKTNEVLFKKQVAAYELRFRAARAAQLSPQKRDEAQRRYDRQAAEDAAFTRELIRRANGR